MISGRAPRVSVSIGRRLSYRGKAPMEEDGAGVSESVQGEFSHPSTRGAARLPGDAKGVGCDTPNLGDGSAFFYEGMVPPQVLFTDEEWRKQEREDPRYTRAGYDRGRAGGVPEWEHITIPRPLPSRLAPSFPTIHRWSYGVLASERIPSWLYYSLFLDTQAVGEDDGSLDLHVSGDAHFPWLKGSSLPQYEDRYRVVLNDIATLTDHGEGVMRELWTAYLDEG
ncbi:hypothetical protein AMTR_s00028p00194160 [Amborella trichopoda]|uniref:Uncharacterized protein n=1 Tax=Amborella trichopoda TaxID=13333 RepID=W1PKU9_AMBTC|nr:hypothetical protein AMTR_s00028p00194160 [Amborella trichopoda]